MASTTEVPDRVLRRQRFAGTPTSGRATPSRPPWSRSSWAECFSLYEISGSGTNALGPLLFGLTLQNTGSYRAAIFSLVVFFVVGLALLMAVNVRRAVLTAGNTPPVAL
jgi:hypothetical protein